MAKTNSRITSWIISLDKNLRLLEGEKLMKVGKVVYPINITNLFSRFESVRLIAPDSFLIYQGAHLKNPDRLLLFASLKDQQASAYLSLMTYEGIRETGTSIFTELPWLSEHDTGKFYAKMQRHREDSLRTGRYNWIKESSHPLYTPKISGFLERSC